MALFIHVNFLLLSKRHYFVMCITGLFFYPVVAERDCLAIAKSPYIVNLFYSFQSKDRIFLVSSVVFLTFSTLTSVSICISSIAPHFLNC